MTSYLLYKFGEGYRTSKVPEIGYDVVALACDGDEERRLAVAEFLARYNEPLRCAFTALSTEYAPLALEFRFTLWGVPLLGAKALERALQEQMDAHRAAIRAAHKVVARPVAARLRECRDRAITRHVSLLSDNDPLAQIKLAIEHLANVPEHPAVSGPCLTEVDLLISLRFSPLQPRYQIGSRVYEGDAFRKLVEPYTLAASFGCTFVLAKRALGWLVAAVQERKHQKRGLALVGGGREIFTLMGELAPALVRYDLQGRDACGPVGLAIAGDEVEGYHNIPMAGFTMPRWLAPYLQEKRGRVL